MRHRQPYSSDIYRHYMLYHKRNIQQSYSSFPLTFFMPCEMQEKRKGQCNMSECLHQHCITVDAQIQGGSGQGDQIINKIIIIYVFLAILVQIARKITKILRQHSMLGGHQGASETFAGGLVMARLQWYLDPLSPYQLRKEYK